ncbi:MAG: hypothetical protein AAGN82_29755 [Myxococcota bacterium]
MVPTGIALTAAGGATLVAGMILWGSGTARTTEFCGLSGCFEVADRTRQNEGLHLMMFGGTLGLMGGGVWLGGALGEPRARYSDAMVVSGAALTSFGASAILANLGTRLVRDQQNYVTSSDRDVGEVSWSNLMNGIGVLSALGGIPLWIFGARDAKPTPTAAELNLPPGYVVGERNPAMKRAGIALTSLGIASFVGSYAVLFAAFENDSGGEFSGIGEAMVASGLGLGALVFGGIGIPMWAIGAERKTVPANEAAAAANSPWLPEVRIGAGQVNLEWTTH